MRKNDMILIIILLSSIFIFLSSKMGATNFLVVLSESMSPTINMGDLIVTTPADGDDIGIGDVVAFKNGNKNIPITHRVVNITEEGFITKGDANEDPDIQIRTGREVEGKVIFWIPFLGYLVHYVRSPLGFAILILIPGILLILGEVKKIHGYVKEGKKKKSKKLYGPLIIMFLLISLLSVTFTFSTNVYPSSAYFYDVENSEGEFNAGIWGFIEFDKIKFSGPDEVCLYERIEWILKITVSNKQTTPMYNVVITDVLPGEVELVNHDNSAGILTIEEKGKSTHLTWNIETLEPYHTAELSLTIATRLSPSGKKYEFTTAGTYDLNEGALLVWDEGSRGPTPPITVVALQCEPEDEIEDEEEDEGTPLITGMAVGGNDMPPDDGNQTEENETNETQVDLTPPLWLYNSTNSTLAGTDVEHSVLWDDDVQLSGYIFSFDDCEELLINETWVPFAGNWSNVTRTINSTSNCTINWMVYANDTSNNWNYTDLFTYTTENITEENTTEENQTETIVVYYNYSDSLNNKLYYADNQSLENYPDVCLDPEYGNEADENGYLATLNYESGICDNINCTEYSLNLTEVNKTVWHSFVFKINENITDIKNINISWAGYAEINNSSLIDGKFRILNNVSYEDLYNITTENQIYDYSIDYNFENYLNSTGYLRFQVWALTDGLSDLINLWTDFVSVSVTI